MQTSGSQPGEILSPRGHLTMSGDMFGYYNWGRVCYCTWDDAIYPTMHSSASSPQHTYTLTITQNKTSIVPKLKNTGAEERVLNTGRKSWAQISTGYYSLAVWLRVSYKISQSFLPCTNRADATLKVVKRITWAKVCEVSGPNRSLVGLVSLPFLTPHFWSPSPEAQMDNF